MFLHTCFTAQLASNCSKSWASFSASKSCLARFPLKSESRKEKIAHCSYLDIYISQNIRLCKGDFEGKFQTILQPKGIIFFIWKFRFIILLFLRPVEFFEICLQNYPYKAWCFVKCKCPNSYSVLWCSRSK